MSETSKCIIYAIRKNGDVEYYAVAQNANAGFLLLWQKLGEKYGVPFDVNNPQATWSAIEKMNLADKYLMASTFDSIILPRQSFDNYVRYLQSFIDRYGTGTWYKILSTIKKAKKDEDIIGVCFNPIDTNENPWVVKEDDGTVRKFNLFRDINNQWGRVRLLTDEYFGTERED